MDANLPQNGEPDRDLQRSNNPDRILPPRKMDHFNRNVGIIFGIGLLVAIAGITMGVLWPSIFDSIFIQELSLTPLSKNFELWEVTPIPIYLKIYMFNWTNPEMVGTDTKPNFVEMGPYVFREVDYKVNKIWNDNGTVTFQRRRVWYFDESLSKGKLSDNVTNLNPILATISYAVRYKTKFVRDVIDRAMRSLKENLAITRTVNELLFEGYNDTLLLIANKIPGFSIPFSKFGWFYGRNGTDDYDGTFNMLTGVNGMSSLGIVKEWNYSNKSKFYEGSCAEIKGTNGDLWPPLSQNKTVPVFVSDICTYLNLTYDNETTFEGLTGSRYISDKTMLDNGTNIPSRSCYCKDRECEPSGVLNISLCKFGAPAVVSLPHFYLADPSYRENITGMQPDKEKHEMKLVLEPTTGVPMQVKAQLQLNLLVQPDPEMSLLRNVNKTYVPMLWFTQEANLTSNYASQVKMMLILPTLGVVTSFGVAGIGILVFFIGVFLCIRRSWKGDEGQRLIDKTEFNGASRTDG